MLAIGIGVFARRLSTPRWSFALGKFPPPPPVGATALVQATAPRFDRSRTVIMPRLQSVCLGMGFAFVIHPLLTRFACWCRVAMRRVYAISLVGGVGVRIWSPRSAMGQPARVASLGAPASRRHAGGTLMCIRLFAAAKSTWAGLWVRAQPQGSRDCPFSLRHHARYLVCSCHIPAPATDSSPTRMRPAAAGVVWAAKARLCAVEPPVARHRRMPKNAVRDECNWRRGSTFRDYRRLAPLEVGRQPPPLLQPRDL